MNVTLSTEQQAALDYYSTHSFTVISGGPGTGKTTLIEHLYNVHKNTLLCTPTGCAANRIRKATNLTAHVISKITYSKSHLDEFINYHVIFDEASMMNVDQLYLIMKELQPSSICIIGDPKQLPCVEGYPIFPILIQCPLIHKCYLTQNRRQHDLQSGLCKTINELGSSSFSMPFFDNNFHFVSCVTDTQAIVKASEHFLKCTDAQMLAYTKDSVTKLNKDTANSSIHRIVCTNNLYIKNKGMVVANGDTGIIKDDIIFYDQGFIDTKRRRTINGTTQVAHQTTFEDARCLTVHKSQGNEFEMEGIIVLTQWGNSSVPLELIYTALSRFKNKVTIFATNSMLKAAVNGIFHYTSPAHQHYVKDLCNIIEAKLL